MVTRTELIFTGCLCTVIFMAPHSLSLEDQIKKNVYNTNGYGTYSFEYETTGGSFRREDGGIIPDSREGSLVVRGEYGYIDSEGQLVFVKYVADANGYHPQGNDDYARFNDRRII